MALMFDARPTYIYIYVSATRGNVIIKVIVRKKIVARIIANSELVKSQSVRFHYIILFSWPELVIKHGTQLWF
jgi:hypothetical protein